MTKEEYLGKLEKIVDTLDTIIKVGKLNTSDAINVLKLEFDIVTATYNCTKEEK